MLDRIRPFHTLVRWAGIVVLTISAPAADLNDTGITTCSNETQNGLSCPVTSFPR
jgi:hypothetical protein